MATPDTPVDTSSGLVPPLLHIQYYNGITYNTHGPSLVFAPSVNLGEAQGRIAINVLYKIYLLSIICVAVEKRLSLLVSLSHGRSFTKSNSLLARASWG